MSRLAKRARETEEEDREQDGEKTDFKRVAIYSRVWKNVTEGWDRWENITAKAE